MRGEKHNKCYPLLDFQKYRQTQAIVESNKRIVASFDNVEVIVTAYNGQYEYEMIINLQPDFVSNRREVEVDMEKCKKRNMKHCTKSKQYDQLGALKKCKILKF